MVVLPYDRGEVGSYLGLNESFVERGVWPRDHQRGEQAESESFKCVGDADNTWDQIYMRTYVQHLIRHNHRWQDQTAGSRICDLTLPAGSSYTACSAGLDLELEHQGCRSHDLLAEENNDDKMIRLDKKCSMFLEKCNQANTWQMTRSKYFRYLYR